MGSTGKERFLGSTDTPKAYHGWDDLNELSEEDIWGGGLHSGECKDHVYMHQRCNENVHALQSTRSPRSRLSVEMETAGFCELGRSRATGLSKFPHLANGGKVHETSGGVSSKSNVNIPQFANGNVRHQQQQQQNHAARSAPMKVPTWANNSDNDDEDQEDEEITRLPPHELIAREHAKSQAMTFGGSGRTLKGMDLRRLRSAVWSRTGFMD